jgi:transposase
MILKHEGDNVREFYSKLPRPVRVGIEATGSMQWFLNLMEELEIECLVGHPAQIRAAEPRKQKHDRRGGRPLSGDLDAFEGTTRSAGLVAAPSSV